MLSNKQSSSLKSPRHAMAMGMVGEKEALFVSVSDGTEGQAEPNKVPQERRVNKQRKGATVDGGLLCPVSR